MNRLAGLNGLTFALLLVSQTALADKRQELCARYPSSPHCPYTSTPCSVCHTAPPLLNDYGGDLKTSIQSNDGNSSFDDAFADIEMLDSDGDGQLNIEEIMCGALPGNSSSSCAPPPPPPPPPSFDFHDISFAVAYRPKVRAKEQRPPSGSKPMRPELLQQVFMNTFGYNMLLCENGTYCNNGQAQLDTLNLGGQDYENVTQRIQEVTPTMPMVLAKRATSFCSAAVASPTSAFGQSLPPGLGSSSANQAAANAIYRALWSAPAPAESLSAAEQLLALAPGAVAGWRAVCVYFFLTKGSLLLY